MLILLTSLLVQASHQDISNLYSVYDNLNLDILNSFPHKSCINFKSLELSKICNSNPSLTFLSQFSVTQSADCEEDNSHYQAISELLQSPDTNQKKSQTQKVIQTYSLRGDKFYDPPSMELVSEKLKSRLDHVCEVLKNNKYENSI